MTFLNSLVAQINFFGAKSVRVYCAGVATGKPRRNIRLWGVQGTAQSKSSEQTHTKNKKCNIMATLKDLCSSVPQSLLRVQTDYNLNLQKQAAYNKRMERLGMERAIFEQCKRNRSKKRVHNTFSTDEAGRDGTNCIHENRFRGSYIHVVSKGRIF